MRYCYLAYFTMLDIIGGEMVTNDILIVDRIAKQRKNIRLFIKRFLSLQECCFFWSRANCEGKMKGGDYNEDMANTNLIGF